MMVKKIYDLHFKFNQKIKNKLKLIIKKNNRNYDLFEWIKPFDLNSPLLSGTDRPQTRCSIAAMTSPFVAANARLDFSSSVNPMVVSVSS